MSAIQNVKTARRKLSLPEDFTAEILDALRDLRPAQVIAFGSRAVGKASEESDLDLIVVLDKKGISKSYSEVLANRMLVQKRLRGVRTKMDVDVLVYTRDEWQRFLASRSSFAREIEETGLRIL